MELKKCYVAFVLLLSLFVVSSCSDDKDDQDRHDPIKLTDMISGSIFTEEYPHLSLTPFSSKKIFKIEGGDGNYDVLNLNENVTEATYNGKWLEVSIVSTGESTLKIFDNSGNTFDLYIRIDYQKKVLNVVQCFPYVKGDDLTIKQKKQLEEEILNAIPVTTEGRYEFTFNAEDGGGEVMIYPSRTVKSRKGTFNVEDVSDGQYRAKQITIHVGDEEWVFVDTSYFNPNTRDLATYYRMLVEDVTARYKEEYPALEYAWAMQVYN